MILFQTQKLKNTCAIITLLAATDSKYNNVDKDWIDVKSNNYFANDELQDYPSSKVDLM